MEVVQERTLVPARREKLAELRSVLRKLFAQYGVRPNTARRVVLAVDEATSNIIEHGHVPDGGSVEVTIEIGEDNVVAQLRDSGIEFDPSAHDGRELGPARERKRGFGLYLIHLITDDVNYRRTEDGKNLLTLTVDSR